MATTTLARWRDMFAPLEAAGGWFPFVAPEIRIEQVVEDGHYVVRAEIPGVDPKKDIDVSLDNGIMRIRAERAELKKQKAHSEFHYGRLLRAVPLPVAAQEDTATAKYANGVLEVTFTLGEAKETGRHIAIEVDKQAGRETIKEIGGKARK
jgi:HSP20 family molecular chaperone IbpA